MLGAAWLRSSISLLCRSFRKDMKAFTAFLPAFSVLELAVILISLAVSKRPGLLLSLLTPLLLGAGSPGLLAVCRREERRLDVAPTAWARPATLLSCCDIFSTSSVSACGNVNSLHGQSLARCSIFNGRCERWRQQHRSVLRGLTRSSSGRASKALCCSSSACWTSMLPSGCS